MSSVVSLETIDGGDASILKAVSQRYIPANRAVGISFKRVAKTSLISLNGSLAVKFSLGQPQKTDAFITAALPACSVLLYRVMGAFNDLWKNL